MSSGDSHLITAQDILAEHDLADLPADEQRKRLLQLQLPCPQTNVLRQAGILTNDD